MDQDQLQTRLELLLSDLLTDGSVSTAQVAAACTHAVELVGVTMPTTDSIIVEALTNRAHHFALSCLRSDWVQKYDIGLRNAPAEFWNRGDVWRHLETTLNRLQTDWSTRLKPAILATLTPLATRTAYRP